MANTLTITVDNPDELLNAGAYGAGAVIRVQSSATEGGAYADLTGTGSTPTIPLAAATRIYNGFDPAGVSTTWYRTRYENAAASRVSDWTAPFPAVSTTAYASLADTRDYLDLPDTSADELVQELLVRASAVLDAKCGRTFYRYPAVSGTEIRTYDSDGYPRLRADIVSLTTVELADYSGGAYTALTSTDWVLRPDRPEPGWPYTSLALSDRGSRSSVPWGYRIWRLTGAYGFPAVPPLIETATLELAREMYWQGRGGRQVGLEFGRLPPLVEEAVRTYGHVLVA